MLADLRIEHLKMLGWPLFTAQSYQANCGHRQEYVVLPAPELDRRLHLVPVLGEAH